MPRTAQNQQQTQLALASLALGASSLPTTSTIWLLHCAGPRAIPLKAVKSQHVAAWNGRGRVHQLVSSYVTLGPGSSPRPIALDTHWALHGSLLSPRSHENTIQGSRPRSLTPRGSVRRLVAPSSRNAQTSDGQMCKLCQANWSLVGFEAIPRPFGTLATGYKTDAKMPQTLSVALLRPQIHRTWDSTHSLVSLSWDCL